MVLKFTLYLGGCRKFHKLGGYKAFIEGDSFSAIQWGSGKSPLPWRLADLVQEVQDISTQLGASFIHIPHEANDMVDILAWKGVLWLNISFDV